MPAQTGTSEPVKHKHTFIRAHARTHRSMEMGGKTSRKNKDRWGLNRQIRCKDRCDVKKRSFWYRFTQKKVHRTKQQIELLSIWYFVNLSCNLINPVREQTNLPQIVKVVLVMDPLIIGQEAVGLVGDVSDIQAQAVVELAFEKLLRQKKWHTLSCHSTPHYSSISLIKLSEQRIFERKRVL